MELRHLRYFIAVAEEENVSRAALRLYVSQPGLSRQIRDLEEEIGFKLLERTAKSVKLTDAGRVFLEEARAVIRRSEEAVTVARAVATGGKAEIKVGYAPSLTIQILPRTLRAYQRDHPKVRVSLYDLSTDEMLQRLSQEKLQLALVVKPCKSMLRGFSFVELDRFELMATVAPNHPLAKKREVSLEQVAKEPLIAYSRDEYPEYHELLGEIFGRYSLRMDILEEHDGITSLAAAVESGRGIGLLTSTVKTMTGNRLKFIPVKPIVGEVVVGAVWKKGLKNPAVEKFVDCAQNTRS